jgi:hypothetical protein
MHIYRIWLVILHICSALTYLPHLITHINRLPFRYLPWRSRIAYMTYWINYCLIVLGVLIWCLFVVCRKRTIWQIIQVSGYLLIAKLVYTSLDVIVRILLHYTYFVIISDLIHVVLLMPAIILTFFLVQHVKEKDIFDRNSQTLVPVDHCV